MGIFSRFFKVGQAHLNKAVEKLEDPSVMIDQAIADRKKSIDTMQDRVAGVIATQRQTEAQYNQELEKVETWEANAQKAIEKSNEDLARKALARMNEHKANADALEPQVNAQKSTVAELKRDLQKAKDDLASFEREKHVLLAQSEAAKVKKDVYEARTNLSKDSSGGLMDRMRERTKREAAEAEAMSELATDSTSLDDEFAELNSSPSSVDDQLAAMKAKMNS